MFLLHPVLCESLKGDKACQCWSFSYAPVVSLYLTSPCHLSESGEGNDKQSKPLQSRSLSLSGALIFKRWTREAESFVVR